MKSEERNHEGADRQRAKEEMNAVIDTQIRMARRIRR